MFSVRLLELNRQLRLLKCNFFFIHATLALVWGSFCRNRECLPKRVRNISGKFKLIYFLIRLRRNGEEHFSVQLATVYCAVDWPKLTDTSGRIARHCHKSENKQIKHYHSARSDGKDKANGAHIVYGWVSVVRVRMPKSMGTTEGLPMYLPADVGTQKRQATLICSIALSKTLCNG